MWGGRAVGISVPAAAPAAVPAVCRYLRRGAMPSFEPSLRRRGRWNPQIPHPTLLPLPSPFSLPPQSLPSKATAPRTKIQGSGTHAFFILSGFYRSVDTGERRWPVRGGRLLESRVVSLVGGKGKRSRQLGGSGDCVKFRVGWETLRWNWAYRVRCGGRHVVIKLVGVWFRRQLASWPGALCFYR